MVILLPCTGNSIKCYCIKRHVLLLHLLRALLGGGIKCDRIKRHVLLVHLPKRGRRRNVMQVLLACTDGNTEM